MQGDADSKGSQDYEYQSLDSDVSTATELANKTKKEIFPEINVQKRLYQLSSGELNLKDQIRRNEATPVQFLYEPSYCRLSK